MDPKAFEVLESKIGQVLERLNVLQRDKSDLQKQIEVLQQRLEQASRELEERTEECETLRGNQRDVQQEEMVRTRISALLAKLETA